MSPGGYLRGAAEIQVTPESADRSRPVSRSVLVALFTLAVAQVVCTLGLFLYFKAQGDLSRMPELNCWKAIAKKREHGHAKDSSTQDDFMLCEGIKQAFNTAVEKELQEFLSGKQFQVGNARTEAWYGSRNNSWPVAHLTVGNITPSNSEQSKVNLTFWNIREGWANLRNLKYHNGKLEILQDGYYFVYANLCFRHHIHKGKEYRDKALQLMMYICKANKNRRPYETLMKGGKTAIWSNNSVYHFYSVYKGGVFKLHAGDQIFIQASYLELLDPAQEATYFGAFKILSLDI
ncbi:tumor necrosis factor ligand superfamily member 11 [Xenopus laevis]|uniref:Tumor necrosis factor ligand superfamily member 11 n=2 Tax=Xenopus laevis TaxID=8355 RepID=A0A1L8HHK6_XENLA|nr:tumor necrosis factor ligand superfamily member 11 [Xenopus laevis]OCT95559.1 hypothetical protein XELAEV_18013246mg [Xenopus laevis]